MDLEITNPTEESLHIVLNEDLGISECDRFKELVIPEIEGKKSITFDLKNVDYIDSSGISAFIAIKKTADSFHAEMKLINIDEIVKSVFQVTKLIDYFNIED